MDRAAAIELLGKYIHDDYTRRHCLASEAVARALAHKLGHDEDLWGLSGLLHDLDYEEVGDDGDRHARRTVEILAPLGFPQEGLDAILAHNGDRLGIPCRTPLDFAVTAGESITGMVFAMALVLPSKALADVKASSIRKRLKESRFAASVSRERIGQYVGLGLSEEDFVSLAVKAMQQADLDWPGGGRS